MTHMIDGRHAPPRRMLPERPPSGGYPPGSEQAKEAVERVRRALNKDKSVSDGTRGAVRRWERER